MIIRALLICLLFSFVGIIASDASRGIYVPNEDAGAYGHKPNLEDDYELISGVEYVQYYLGHPRRFIQSRGREFVIIYIVALASIGAFRVLTKKRANT